MTAQVLGNELLKPLWNDSSDRSKGSTLLRCEFSSNPSTVFNTIPMNITAGVFTEIDNLILKFVCEYKGLRIAKTSLKKKGQSYTTLFFFFSFSFLIFFGRAAQLAVS